jgi:threonine/homoserine/homoserine lactone efflux protein
VLGISAIILASALLFSVVKYLGAAYLIYLGLRAIFTRQPIAAFGETVSRITARSAFRQAILAELLNPKTALFFLAFLPQFVRPENGSVFLQLAVLGIILVLLGLLSTLAFAVCAGRVGAMLRRNPAVLRWQGKVVGTIYCALGARLAFQER